jgi:hypothetical protein
MSVLTGEGSPMVKQSLAKVTETPGPSDSDPGAEEQGPPGKWGSGTQRKALTPNPESGIPRAKVVLLMVAAFILGGAVGAMVVYNTFRSTYLDGGGVKTCTEADVGTSCGTNMKWCGPPTICRCRSSCN